MLFARKLNSLYSKKINHLSHYQRRSHAPNNTMKSKRTFSACSSCAGPIELPLPEQQHTEHQVKFQPARPSHERTLPTCQPQAQNRCPAPQSAISRAGNRARSEIAKPTCCYSALVLDADGSSNPLRSSDSYGLKYVADNSHSRFTSRPLLEAVVQHDISTLMTLPGGNDIEVVDVLPRSCSRQCVNGGGIMYRRGGVKMYHGRRRQLVPIVHGRAPRAGRRALRAAGGGPRVGGACGPTGSSGVTRTGAGGVIGSA